MENDQVVQGFYSFACMKVFITRPIPDVAYEILKKANISFTVWNRDKPPSKEELIQESAEADGILNVGNFKFDKDVLAEMPQLKVISLMSVGFDHVDIDAAKSFGIKVGHTPDVLSHATADTAFLLLLATSRKAFHHHKRMLNGQWGMFQPTEGLGIELHGKKLGIFGLGRIGFEMAKKCQLVYQMEILYHNRTRNEEAEKELNAQYVSFQQLLEESDVISVHSALTDATRQTFNYNAFKAMKPDAIFINTGRGGLHVEDDLIRALQEKELWGAGLDVFEQEPTPPNNPLLSMETVCTLPHIGSATLETRTAMAKMATENLTAALKGEKMPAQVV